VKSVAAGAPLTQRDSSVIKAIGILAIVLHNFFHHMPSAAKENEFSFDPGRFWYFLAKVADPHQTFQAFLSYFGHFGVQLFIFLSAYGLAIKYWTTPSWSAFVWSRIRRIYPTYFLALSLYLLLKLAQDGPSGLTAFLQRQAHELVLTTLGVSTLLPGYGLPPVGPWWFLPFIVQFYCLWGLLASFSRRFGGPGLVILSAVSLGLTVAFPATLGRHYDINLLTTPIGHLPELSLGIAYARFGLRVGTTSALAAALFFLLGNLDVWFWPLTYISALALLLYAYQPVSGALRKGMLLAWIGQVSMPLFFVNGFLRGLFWTSGRLGGWYVQVATGLCFALVSLGVASVLWLVELRLMASARRADRFGT
jgi:peptidoglycan/LPS O-acetylase OafA/YrhL